MEYGISFIKYFVDLNFIDVEYSIHAVITKCIPYSMAWHGMGL